VAGEVQLQLDLDFRCPLRRYSRALPHQRAVYSLQRSLTQKV